MKKLILVVIIGSLFAAEAVADLYEEAQAGVEPYATHFAEAENLCLEMGYSYPGFVVPPLEAKLKDSEMNLCIERQINHLITREDRVRERLIEIEQKLNELLEQRKELIKAA